MRDLLVTLIVFGALPYVFSRPHIGILLWSWVSYMNPHKLAWGFAYNFPFAVIIGVVTIISVFFSRKKLRFFWSPIIGWLLFFNLWMLITTIFSLQPEDSWAQYDKIVKIQFMTFIMLLVFNDREKIHSLIWVIVLSFGYFGIKGGVFTLVTGGGSHVLGPNSGFMGGNTTIGLAFVMILPLIWYLYLNTTQLWVRAGLALSMLLVPVAILGTQSRGALLAIAGIALFLWLKSSKKLVLLIVIVAMIPFLFMFMPQSWHDRMGTISDYEQDSSAMGRIQAWELAYKLAVARPLIGGGFEAFTEANYEHYTPGLIEAGTGSYHDVHSIYFEVLGEHGFVGLTIFLIIGYLGWRIGKRIIKLSKGSESNKWAGDLAAMIQVSLIGYAIGGAFLGLAYFDLPYQLIAILILTLRIIEEKDTTTNTMNTNFSVPATPSRLEHTQVKKDSGTAFKL